MQRHTNGRRCEGQGEGEIEGYCEYEYGCEYECAKDCDCAEVKERGEGVGGKA